MLGTLRARSLAIRGSSVAPTNPKWMTAAAVDTAISNGDIGVAI